MRTYAHFVDSVSLKGRLTGVYMGRGMKIRVDNGPSMDMPELIPLDSVPVFHFETGSNIGDSIVKEAGSDRMQIRTSVGKWSTWKAVP